MVLTLELPIRAAHSTRHDAFASYEHRFGALPEGVEELPQDQALALIRQSLRSGTPITPAELFH